jgi:hypothetical protein
MRHRNLTGNNSSISRGTVISIRGPVGSNTPVPMARVWGRRGACPIAMGRAAPNEMDVDNNELEMTDQQLSA